MSKLPDVRGRVDYISNPKRQEYLYAAYSTVKPEFWQYLSEHSQHEFHRSNQSSGKCIEARELIIALPESLTAADPDSLLKTFMERFQQKYGMHCAAALHHNKTKTNYHIHLIFADRDLLEKPQIKYATRNMFYDEDGRHVRTKKDILGPDGAPRPGCHIIPKGSPYEISMFSARKDLFKSRQFLVDVKTMFTDLINQTVTREEDRQQVFDTAGPYLPTKKIGKNNPLESEIRRDNQLRQEWNQTVDQVLLAGGTTEEVTEFKTEEVVQKIAESVRENGSRPGLFADILLRALTVLVRFLDILMQEPEKDARDQRAAGPKTRSTGKVASLQKRPRPDSRREKLHFIRIESIYEKLKQQNRKLYALQKQKVLIQQALNTTPNNIFHRKDRKYLAARVEGMQRQIESTQAFMETILKSSGYNSVREISAEYLAAKTALEEVQRRQAEWDGRVPTEPQKEKPSVLKELAAQKKASERRSAGNLRGYGRNER